MRETLPTRAPLLGEPLPVELMNTTWADRDGVHDALATGAETLAWLRAVQGRVGLEQRRLSDWLDSTRPAGLEQTAEALRDVRDALRRLADSSTDDPRPAAASPIVDRETAVATLNRGAAASPVWPHLAWDGETPTSDARCVGSPGLGIVSIVAAGGISLFSSGERLDLRACLAPGCVLYFVQQHGRRTWCSASCGNRARVARHYRRTTRPS